jgi:hypothetical protein
MLPGAILTLIRDATAAPSATRQEGPALPARSLSA